MVVIDTHLARGSSNGGFTFHDRLVVPASTPENNTTELMLEHLTEQEEVASRLELVLVDRGVTEAAARKLGRDYGLELRRVGWDDKQPVFRPIRHARRVEVAHGRPGRARRLAKSFENTTTCSAAPMSHVSR